MLIGRDMSATPSGRASSAFDPLREPLFGALWTASVVSNCGT
jgi:hypothetical protein